MRPASASVSRLGMNSWKARHPRAAHLSTLLSAPPPAPARGQFKYGLVGLPAPTERLARAPIVADFVIVPLREQRHLGIEGKHIFIEQVVFVIAAKLRERLGDL